MSPRLQAVLLVMAGGALGALSRFAVGSFIRERMGDGFPWGTFVVNVTGCFALGWLLALSHSRFPGLEPWRPAFAIGFLGAYTTFATFAFEGNELMTHGAWLKASLYVLGSVALGLGALRLGELAGR